MKRIGLLLLLTGVGLVPASCVVFPSQFGSDYMGINLGGVLGGVLGLSLVLVGLAMLAWTEDSRS